METTKVIQISEIEKKLEQVEDYLLSKGGLAIVTFKKVVKNDEPYGMDAVLDIVMKRDKWVYGWGDEIKYPLNALYVKSVEMIAEDIETMYGTWMFIELFKKAVEKYDKEGIEIKLTEVRHLSSINLVKICGVAHVLDADGDVMRVVNIVLTSKPEDVHKLTVEEVCDEIRACL